MNFRSERTLWYGIFGGRFSGDTIGPGTGSIAGNVKRSACVFRPTGGFVGFADVVGAVVAAEYPENMEGWR